jgi:hypothetical protein
VNIHAIPTKHNFKSIGARAGFRGYWRRKSRRRGGRPQIEADLRALPNVSKEHRRLRPRAIGCEFVNVDGDSNYVRVQVLTNSGALDRDKQIAVVRQLTDLVAKAAGDPSLTKRTTQRPCSVVVLVGLPAYQ